MNTGFDGSMPRPARPTRYFQSGAVAGCGSVLWVLDVSHPTLLRRGPDGSVTIHEVPGDIRGSGIVGWRQRWLHADESGCWVVGADGVAHCSQSGEVQLIDDAPVSVSALVEGVLATAVDGDHDDGGNSVVRLRSLAVSARATTAPVPAAVDDIHPSPDGFLVSMRTDGVGPPSTVTGRGQWCARLGLDGAVALGDPWPRAYWAAGGVCVLNLGAPMTVSNIGTGSHILDDRLVPVARLPFTSCFRRRPTACGVWLAQTSSHLARTRQGRLLEHPGDRIAYVYFRLDSRLTAFDAWAVADGYPKDLTVTEVDGRLWVVTTTGLCASDVDAVFRSGTIDLAPVGTDDLHLPEVAIRPPAEVGDPERWAEAERARLLEQNRGQGLLDIEIDGWFQYTGVFVTFTVATLPGVTFARRYALFDRDGRPALWRGPPTLMESIRLDIAESGGVERLARSEPGRFG